MEDKFIIGDEVRYTGVHFAPQSNEVIKSTSESIGSLGVVVQYKCESGTIILGDNTQDWELVPKNNFQEERSGQGENAQRYGKDLIANFNPDEDLVFWDLKFIQGPKGYWVKLVHPEVSALCPVSGYPDSGKVTIEFKPDLKTVELKAFKLWLNSYRDKHISHEEFANVIYNILAKGLDPKQLYVKLEMAPRGNVTTIVEVGNSFNTCVKIGEQ